MIVKTVGADSTTETDQTTEDIQEVSEDVEQDTPADTETQGEAAESGEEGEIEVTIGEATTASEDENKAPVWVKDLRKSSREKDRKIRELQERLDAVTPKESGVVVGQKPTLESCEYDADVFEAKLDAWKDAKSKADEQARKLKADQEAEQAAWQKRLDDYQTAKAELKVADFDDAEQLIKDLFSQQQQGIIVHGAQKPALLAYAIGKNPAKAKELSAITDPVKFAFAVAHIERDLKVTPKKNTPAPEKKLGAGSGGPASSSSNDAHLAKLREEAARTGDMTKVMQFKAKLRAAGK